MTNFLTRFSVASGYDPSGLQGGKVFYEPTREGGATLFHRDGSVRIEIGDAKHAFWLNTIANSASTLEHEWDHTLKFFQSGQSQSVTEGYLRELSALRAQYYHPSFKFVTSEYEKNFIRLYKLRLFQYNQSLLR